MNKNAQIIFDAINESHEHPTAEQVYLQLQNAGTKMSMATVYNNLNSLHKQGLIRKISLSGFPDRYDNTTRHDHLVCKQCGNLKDVTLDDLTKTIQKKIGFEIEGYDLEILYTCPTCKEARAEV